MKKCAHDGMITFNERVNGWRYMCYTPGEGVEELNNDQTITTPPASGKCETCGKRVPLPPEAQ